MADPAAATVTTSPTAPVETVTITAAPAAPPAAAPAPSQVPVPPAGLPAEPAPIEPEPAEAVDAPDDEAEAPAPKPAGPTIPYKGRVDFPPAPYVQVLAVRSGPGTSYPIVARLPEGTTVTVVKVQGSWGELSRGGWSSLSYVDKI